MTNRDLEAAWAYHNGTKHSYESIYTDPHHLDWENQPLPFKIYTQLESLPLPRDLLSAGVPALSAVSAFNAPAEAPSVPSLALLGSLLYFSTGITKGIPDEFADALTKDAAFPKRMGRPEEYGRLVCAIVETPMLNGSCIRLDAGQRFAPK